MKNPLQLAILALSATACLSAPAFAQSGVAHEVDQSLLPRTYSTRAEPEARADELRLSGKCARAIPIYSQQAAQGAGYEIAQYGMGLCLLDIGKTQTGADRAASYRDGVSWIVKAATAGVPRAQASLVTIYLDGEVVPADPIEAGKYALLYRANDARRQIGMPDIAPGLKSRLDSALTDKTWDEAQARAKAVAQR